MINSSPPVLDDSDFIPVLRDKLLFSGNRKHRAIIRLISTCHCVVEDVKAVTEDDTSGANIIILSKSKLEERYQKPSNRVYNLLVEADAIAPSVQVYSKNITSLDRAIRKIYISTYEKPKRAA